MTKKKTSKKPKHPSDFIDKPRKLRTKEGLSSFNASQWLSNKKNIQKALWECLATNDIESFKEILKAHFDAVCKTDAAKITGISRRTLYRIFEPGSNPTLSNVAKLLEYLDLAA